MTRNPKTSFACLLSLFVCKWIFCTFLEIDLYTDFVGFLDENA